jgi:ABC-type antimicrobial peptide transport system permease subunit
VGQSIGLGQSTTTIVGVVGDVHHDGAGQAAKAELYLPQSQRPSRAMTLLLRGRSAPGDLAPLLRTEVRSLDADQPVGQVYTLETLQADSVRAPRLFMLVFGVFAAVALGLAAMGIYGVMAYAVAQRTREFGLRMALGANPRDVRAMVLAQGARLALYGMTLGLALALGLSGVFRSFLYEVSPTDPWTFAGVPLVLGGVLLLACYVPARRATRLDPMAALRTE